MMEKFQYDITGCRFGNLTAIKPVGVRGHKTYWLCRCDCGKETVVARPNLSTGKTKSCGCLRSSSPNIKRGNYRPVEISDEDKQWIIENYADTKNADIQERFGLSEGWLHRFARLNSLHKSSEFKKLRMAEMTEAACASHRRNGTYPPKGFVIPKCEKYQFKPGHSESPEIREKRLAHTAESMKRTRKLEKARVTFNLPQRTKLRIKKQPREMINQRTRLIHKLGYHVERGGRIAYYDENTNRDNIYERRKLGDKHYIYWEFRPLKDKAI